MEINREELIATAEKQINQFSEIINELGELDRKYEQEQMLLEQLKKEYELDLPVGMVHFIANEKRKKQERKYTGEIHHAAKTEKIRAHEMMKQGYNADAPAPKEMFTHVTSAYYRFHPTGKELREFVKNAGNTELKTAVDLYNSTHGGNMVNIADLDNFAAGKMKDANLALREFLKDEFKKVHPTYKEVYKLGRAYSHNLNFFMTARRGVKYGKFCAEKNRAYTEAELNYVKKGKPVNELAKQIAYNAVAYNTVFADISTYKEHLDIIKTAPEEAGDRMSLISEFDKINKDSIKRVREIKERIEEANLKVSKAVMPELDRIASAASLMKSDVLSKPGALKNRQEIEKLFSGFTQGMGGTEEERYAAIDAMKNSGLIPSGMCEDLRSMCEKAEHAKLHAIFGEGTKDEDIRLIMSIGENESKLEMMKRKYDAALLSDEKTDEYREYQEISKQLESGKKALNELPATSVYKLTEDYKFHIAHSLVCRKQEFEMVASLARDERDRKRLSHTFNKSFGVVIKERGRINRQMRKMFRAYGISDKALKGHPDLANAMHAALVVCTREADRETMAKQLNSRLSGDPARYQLSADGVRGMSAEILKYETDCMVRGINQPVLTNKIIEMAQKYSAEFIPKMPEYGDEFLVDYTADERAANRDEEDKDMSSVNRDESEPVVADAIKEEEQAMEPDDDEISIDDDVIILESPDEGSSEAEANEKAEEFNEAAAAREEEKLETIKENVERDVQDIWVDRANTAGKNLNYRDFQKEAQEELKGGVFAVAFDISDLSNEEFERIKKDAKKYYLQAEEKDGRYILKSFNPDATRDFLFDCVSDETPVICDYATMYFCEMKKETWNEAFEQGRREGKKEVYEKRNSRNNNSKSNRNKDDGERTR